MNSKLRSVILPLIVLTRPLRCRIAKWRSDSVFRYHRWRFDHFSGMANPNTEEASRAFIMMNAHVLEKGLTMPRRRLGFGRDKVLQVIGLVSEYEKRFGHGDVLVSHAAGLVLAYRKMHEQAQFDQTKDRALWNAVNDFCADHATISPSIQPHVSRAEFYAHNNAPFPEFAAHRHTLRHYAGPVSFGIIRQAVELAQTAPSACNRQHVRVHCISNHHLRDELLLLQNGNRGFGSDADKLLVVTADVAGLFWQMENMDIYVNAGIFLMNLCYALHYYKVGSCILNWYCLPSADRAARRLLNLTQSETIVALLACGAPPEEFDYASSPRRKIDGILTEHT